MIQFQENTQTDRRTEGWTLFHRTLPATAEGSTSTIPVDWLKSQRYRVQCWSNQKLLHQCHHAKNQHILFYTTDFSVS